MEAQSTTAAPIKAVRACKACGMSSSAPINDCDFWDLINNKKGEKPVRKPYIIGVAGGTASGKTSVCEYIVKGLREALGSSTNITTVALDSFYKELSEEEIALAHSSKFNFDHPTAFDWTLVKETLDKLSRGKQAEVPHYDYVVHGRVPEKATSLFQMDVILLEGILVFYEESIRDYMDMKVFVDTDDDTRLARRIRRDTVSRGRSVESILAQYEMFVKPAYDDFIFPTKKFSDIVIPRGYTNEIAMDLLIRHLQFQISERRRALGTKVQSMLLHR